MREMTTMPDVPTNNIELYLANLAGESSQLPDVPTSKIERYLAKIIENGGSGGGGGGGGSVTVDSALSGSSTNPVQNKVVKNALDAKITAPSSPATGAFLVYNGSAWVAQTLATWQGGSF